jgi:hypothetical protein
MVTGRRSTLPNRCSTAATIRSRTCSPLMPPVAARLVGHGFTVTAVQCEGEPHFLIVVTAGFKAVGDRELFFGNLKF